MERLSQALHSRVAARVLHDLEGNVHMGLEPTRCRRLRRLPRDLSMILLQPLQLTRGQPTFVCLGNSRTLAASRNWLLAGRKQTLLT